MEETLELRLNLVLFECDCKMKLELRRAYPLNSLIFPLYLFVEKKDTYHH